MRLQTSHSRNRDVRFNFLYRNGKIKIRNKGRGFYYDADWQKINHWIEQQSSNGLQVELVHKRKKALVLTLPEVMNFSDDYERTTQHINAIRILSDRKGFPDPSYKLAAVNFSKLKKISTSSALVLTAELSKWDDAIRQRLRPNTEGWDKVVLKQFFDLGFFELFKKSSATEIKINKSPDQGIRFVKYLKGKCGEVSKTKILKCEIRNVVGESIDKWTFLHSGLSEAITNVSHHAYPADAGYKELDKNWYLTGSYDEQKKIIKIVFYDQGVGIPKTLPASAIWERALEVMSGISIVDQKRDEVLLKAAVELDRTRTYEEDRGKGLQDLLEFIKQRGEGYLSIMSLKGLYKQDINEGITKVKTEGFSSPICGTLIVWCATL
ncbi:hypothetical protein IFU23_16495 [Pantoea agglomerans]|uniref:hypothetical protein n=1 Tax=Enterobacter agglomerans TaxID=549 RepID=UPI00077A68EE|nr:hypothetical protein [Pantoea agglomerans]MBD8159692.1 hypothetical protein [Pantoea agglomerans]MBD8231953.1 hypothetical protein [Pantoea agglomerans]